MYEAAVKALLTADAALAALMLGGCYSAEGLPRLGITQARFPDTAYDAAGRLRPLLLVVGFALIPQGGVNVDEPAGWTAVRQTVRVNLYTDADGAYSDLDAAAQRVYDLLQVARFSTAGGRVGKARMISAWHNDRAPELGNALLRWSEWSVGGAMLRTP